jgi:predicted nucleic acid-binding protein
VLFETQAKLFIQGLVLENKVELVWSYILKFENSRNLFEAKRTAISQWEKISYLFVSASDGTVALAKDIAKTGIKDFDALHVACAIAAKCDYFITVDSRVLKYRNETVKICNPIEFLNTYITHEYE